VSLTSLYSPITRSTSIASLAEKREEGNRSPYRARSRNGIINGSLNLRRARDSVSNDTSLPVLASYRCVVTRDRERERERESRSLTWIIVRAGRPLREPATLVIYTLLPPPPFLHASVGEGGSCCGSSGDSQVDIHSGSSRRPEARTTRARAVNPRRGPTRIARVGQLESTPWRKSGACSMVDIGREFYRLLALKKGSVGNRTRSRSNNEYRSRGNASARSLSLSDNCSLETGLWSNG